MYLVALCKFLTARRSIKQHWAPLFRPLNLVAEGNGWGTAGRNAGSWAAMKAQPEHRIKGEVSEANKKNGVGAEEHADN